MKRKATLSALLALVVGAPALVAPIVAPSLAPTASAQAPAEYPDVPLDHWAYNAINKLSAAGVLEGYPNGQYQGNRAMTRYEFAVAIARLLQNLPTGGGPAGPKGDTGAAGPAGPKGDTGATGPAGTVPNISNLVTKQELADAIDALRKEFRPELEALGVRIDGLDARVTALENRVVKPPRLTITPSILHRTGVATYIDNELGGRNGGTVITRLGIPGVPDIPDDLIDSGGYMNGNPGYLGTFRDFTDYNDSAGDKKFSYTDFEVRMTDRITDKLTLNAAIRSLSGTQEDPWTGEFSSTSTNSTPGAIGGIVDGSLTSAGGDTQLQIREANVVADLSGSSTLGLRGLTATLGRQRTQHSQGLLYSNDLAPTDQLHLEGNLGPVQIGAFIGTNNNNTSIGLRNPYIDSGAVRYLGTTNDGQTNSLVNAVIGFPVLDPTDENYANNFFGPGQGRERRSGAAIGFPGEQSFANDGDIGGALTDDNESMVHAGINLFKIAGQPVRLGASYLFDGVEEQRGYGFDLTIPLFNRNVGIEYVRQTNYFSGEDADGKAYNITVPIIRSSKLDLNFAYGKADDEFEYFVSSSANPFARTYGEAIFDRQMALGAPMINGDGEFGDPQYMAAKKVYDIGGTLRIIKRLPIDFRYYSAEGTGGRELGNVLTVGTTFALTQGLDLEVKYGRYSPKGDWDNINYFRVGANVGF
jgi:hypothetical protein